MGPVQEKVRSFHSKTLLNVFGHVVGAVNSVLRTGEGDLSVYDEDLAVVTQVGSLPLELPRLERQHKAPLHTGVVEHLHEVLVRRNCREPMCR